MSIFKNANETAFVGGRKHFTDVIKNSGEGNLLVWKQPEEDFNTNSTLIVMPGETAIFVKNGQVEQVFTNGRYKLSTQNYPFISRLRNAFSGGVSTFNCVVYFFRGADSMEIMWGSDSPIAVRDKRFDIVSNVRARGAYKVRIENPELLLSKLLGSNIESLGQEELSYYFSNTFSGIIKAFVSNFLNQYNQELIGIEAHLEEASRQIEPRLDAEVKGYGLTCIKFALSALEVDQTQYSKIDDYQIDRNIGQIKTAEGNAAAFRILGDNWARQKAADILTNYSQNPGSGGFAAAGAGMSAGLAAGSVVGEMAKQLFAPMSNYGAQQPQSQAPAASAFSVSSRFTPQNTPQQNAGAPAENEDDFTKTLQKLKQVFEAGYITQEEYEAKKAEILSRI